MSEIEYYRQIPGFVPHPQPQQRSPAQLTPYLREMMRLAGLPTGDEDAAQRHIVSRAAVETSRRYRPQSGDPHQGSIDLLAGQQMARPELTGTGSVDMYSIAAMLRGRR